MNQNQSRVEIEIKCYGPEGKEYYTKQLTITGPIEKQSVLRWDFNIFEYRLQKVVKSLPGLVMKTNLERKEPA